MGSGKPRGLRILASTEHLRTSVDPFASLPCGCREIVVHTTSGRHLGDDLVECRCKTVVRLGDLYGPLLALLSGS